jgi:uncharacterized protein YcbX
MTAYCTYSDVDALMSVTHSSATLPTATSVTDFCLDVSAELDGVAQAVGYAVPITSTAGLALMNSYATMGAAVKAWHAGFQAQNEPANVAYWREAYEGFLARLRRGEQTIPAESIDDANASNVSFSLSPKSTRYWTNKRSVDDGGARDMARRRFWGHW